MIDITKLQDICLDDLPKYTQWQTYMNNGQVQEAIQFVKDTPTLKYKLFDEFNWERLNNAIIEDTPDSIQGQFLNDFAPTLHSMNTVIIPPWDNTVSYKAKNMVIYNNMVYVAISDTIGDTISRGDIWKYVHVSAPSNFIWANEIALPLPIGGLWWQIL